MYYVPVTANYWRLPVNYVPVYSTLINRIATEDSNAKLNNDLTNVQKQLAELREELYDLRLEKETCRLCSATIQCDEDCLICYPRIRDREENYSRATSPVHYCSICQDYVIDQELSEYLSRQLDLHRLRHRYIPEPRPVWIPTAYKHDYPHRRWATRQSHFSEP
jgi:hypothetical protein